MIPSYYAKIRSPRLTFEDAARRYLEWALGTGRYRRLGHRRRKSGVLPRWSVDEFLSGGTFTGKYDATAHTRAGENVFLLHLSHRDAESPEIFWHTVVRIHEADGTTHIEHGTARTAPRGYYLEPLVASPRILRDIGTDPSLDVSPKNIFNDPVRVRPGETSDFVKYVLIDAERELPFAVVSPTDDGDYLIDPERMANRLSTVASVAVLESPECTYELHSELKARGFADEVSKCFGGAVRCYGPDLRADDEGGHYIWLSSRISDIGVDPTESLAAEVAGHVLSTTLPRRFFFAIQEFDREDARRRALGLIDKLEARPPEQEHASAEAVRELTAQLTKTVETQDYLVSQMAELEDLLESTQQKLRVAEQQRDQTQEALKGSLRERASAEAHAVADAVAEELRPCLRRVVAGEASLEECLQSVASLFPESVVVLPSAYRSARDSASFKKTADALSLLLSLAARYPEVVVSGGDDAVEKLFGVSYAPTESKTVRNNKHARKLRTFEYDGKPVEMLRHLKIGVKPSIAETLRIHFHWDADRERVVIGHCGKHLDFK